MAIASHIKWLKEGADKWNERREKRHFIPSLRKANLAGMNLYGVNLRGAQLGGANLKGANLRLANLIGADLTGADLSDAELAISRCNAAIFKRAILKNVNAVDGSFSQADFASADLSDADFRHAYVTGCNFSQARLKGLDFRSDEEGRPTSIDLSTVKGLTQRQLADIIGDTGIELPEGLYFPISWSTWGEAVSEAEVQVENLFSATAPKRTLFISYAKDDRDRARRIRSVLEGADIEVWWDGDIPPGNPWRETIQRELDHASAILTIWTENSVLSKAVAEEAAVAQRAGKFIHARLDSTPVPYGFSEIQYADLRNWDGSPGHPEMRRLIQAIVDKLNPPSPQEIRDRLISATPLAALVEDGHITARDSPPDARPPISDHINLEQRLVAQEVLAKKALTALQTLDNNLGEAIRLDLSHFVTQIERRPASWYILSDSVADIQIHLELDDVPWPGSTRNSIENLCRNHEALRPFLQPTQPLPFAPNAPLQPPELDASSENHRDLLTLAESAVHAFQSAEAETVLAEPAKRAGEYLAAEVAEASATQHSYGEEMAQRRTKKIKKAILALAGFVGSTIVAIGSGVSGNLLTSPDAAKVFLGRLQQLFDNLAALFL